jgi:hypothetical protein
VSTLSSEEFDGGSVYEFHAVISLKTFDRETELCLGKGNKLNKCWWTSNFFRSGKPNSSE